MVNRRVRKRARSYGALACGAWLLLVGIPLLLFHVRSRRLALFDHVHAGVLWLGSCFLVYWLGANIAKRRLAVRRRQPPRRRVPRPAWLQPLAVPRSEPPWWVAMPKSFICCSLWTIVVGIPVLTYHINSPQFTVAEHIRAGVLFFLAEGAIYWLCERSRSPSKPAPATHPLGSADEPADLAAPVANCTSPTGKGCTDAM